MTPIISNDSRDSYKMKVTYFFLYGRKERLAGENTFAKEMFYGFNYFNDKYSNTEILQFHERNKISNKILNFFDRVLNKLTKLPIYMKHSISFENIKIIYKTNYLIMANDRIALSIIPILLLMKLINPNLNSTFFVMGLLNHNIVNKYQLLFRNLILKILFFCTKNIIFLGEGEYIEAKKMYPASKNKFYFLPFMVDTDFWKNKNENYSEYRDGILFVGMTANEILKKLLS